MDCKKLTITGKTLMHKEGNAAIDDAINFGEREEDKKKMSKTSTPWANILLNSLSL